MGRLAGGMRALIARQQAAAGGPLPVTYTRPAANDSLPAASVTLAGCWAGQSEYTRDQPETGQSVSWAERDYLIPVALLAGGLAVPEDGDLITDPNVPDPTTGRASVFQVKTTAGGPPWRFSDQGQTLFRVHTKRKA